MTPAAAVRCAGGRLPNDHAALKLPDSHTPTHTRDLTPTRCHPPPPHPPSFLPIIPHPVILPPQWIVFFADERCVPLDSDDSNYKGCDELLFSKVALPRDNIHAIDATLGSAADMAAAYAAAFSKAVPDGVFDLVLLGLGPDGHTASLFPGHALLEEREVTVASIIDSPKPPSERITFTLPVLCAGRQLAFVAAGASKTEKLEEIFLTADCPLPAARVRQGASHACWFVDRAAAGDRLVVAEAAPESKY